MGSFSMEPVFPSLPPVDMGLSLLMECSDVQTLEALSSADMSTCLSLEEPLFPAANENVDSDADVAVPLLEMQTAAVCVEMGAGSRREDLNGDTDLMSESDVRFLEHCVRINERTQVAIDLEAIVDAALQKSGEMSCAPALTRIPRVVRAAAAPPRLNVAALGAAGSAGGGRFDERLAAAPLSGSGKRRYYGCASSSRYCHICGRGSSGAAAAKCSNSRYGTCRKIVCDKCLLVHDAANARARGQNEHTWVCTHCRMQCPASARCHQYARNNMKRRLRKRATAEKEEQEREEVGVSKDFVSEMIAMGDFGGEEAVKCDDDMVCGVRQEGVSGGMEHGMVEDLLLFDFA